MLVSEFPAVLSVSGETPRAIVTANGERFWMRVTQPDKAPSAMRDAIVGNVKVIAAAGVQITCAPMCAAVNVCVVVRLSSVLNS